MKLYIYIYILIFSIYNNNVNSFEFNSSKYNNNSIYTENINITEVMYIGNNSNVTYIQEKIKGSWLELLETMISINEINNNEFIEIKENKSVFEKAINFFNLGHHTSSHTCGIKNIDSDNKIRPFRIVMAITDNFIDVLLNWLIYYNQICPDRSNIYLICLDKNTELKMSKYGLQCSQVLHSSSKSTSYNKLWLLRVRVTKQLLNSGFDVMISDSDAIWLQNPFSYIEKFSSSDLIGSRASFPEDIAKHYGATFCMGFAYIKSTAGTKEMWKQLADSMSKTARPDDQRMINQMMLKRGLKFPKNVDYLGSTQPITGFMRMNSIDMRVTLLPHENFRRICEGVKLQKIHDSIITHCYSLKTGTAKQQSGKEFQLWAVKDNYIDIEYSSKDSIDSYLSKISTIKQKRRRLIKCNQINVLNDKLNVKLRSNNYEERCDNKIARSPCFQNSSYNFSCFYTSPIELVREFEEYVVSMNSK